MTSKETSQIVVGTGEFGAAISAAKRFTNSKSTLLVLGNIHLKADPEGWLTIEATNLEQGFVKRIRTKLQTGEGEFNTCIPAATLSSALSAWDGGNVVLALNPRTQIVTVSGEKAGGARVNINCIDAGEFPPMPKLDTDYDIGMHVPRGQFAAYVQRVASCASTDDARPILTGVLLRHEKAGEKAGVRMASADGFRLATDMMIAENTLNFERNAVVVPYKALLEAAGMVGAGDAPVVLSLAKARNQVTIKVDDNTAVISQVIEGTFPDYEQIIPRQPDMWITVDAAAFSRKVKYGLSLFHSNILRLTVDATGDAPMIHIDMRDEEGGDYHDEFEPLAFDGRKMSSKFVIGMDARLLVGMLPASGTLKVGMSAENSPIKFLSAELPNYVGVLMPMHIA